MRYRIYNSFKKDFKFDKQILALFLIWVFGIILGFAAGENISDTAAALTRYSLSGPKSFCGIIFSLFFPIVLGYLLIRFSAVRLLLLLIFLKAYGFGCCIGILSSTFGSASWLAGILCLFSDSCCCFILIWYTLNYFLTNSVVARKFILATCFLLIGIAIMEYLVLSPFFTAVLNY